MRYNQLVKAIDSASRELLGRAAAVVNQSLVIRNWLVGAYLVEFEQNGEDRAKYGVRLLSRLAADLKQRGIGGLSVQMLERTRLLYGVYPQLGSKISSPLVRELGNRLLLPGGGSQKSSPPVRISRRAFGGKIPSSPLTELSAPATSGLAGHSVTTGYGIGQPRVGQSSGITPLSPEAVLHFSWTHILELIRIDDPLKRAFYENECLKGNWSKRQLQRQIGSLLFERTGLSRNKAAVIKRARAQEPQETIEDLIRDPYVLEFTGLAQLPQYTESDLETALLDHLQKFLLELGTGFCFEARQFRVTLGNEHDYVDLVFYQRRLRCHVLLDLKVRPFQHGDAGQMNYYLNYFKDRMMAEGDQPPVGILLCSDKDHTKVQFATAGMDNRLFVSRYLTVLPSAEQLQCFVETDRARVEAAMEQHARTGAKPAAAKSTRKKSRPSSLTARRR
ncbi:MAG: PDDEXK nuclease domain-containing protein [Verrucomicrobiota bacterium]|jgi:predicted nuclease of restriction endonuclease-like (RecB) superfamily